MNMRNNLLAMGAMIAMGMAATSEPVFLDEKPKEKTPIEPSHEPTPSGHVRLSNLATEKVKDRLPTAIKAADEVADKGGSPRAQLDAARKATNAKLGYTSHCGAKQRARNLARMNKE